MSLPIRIGTRGSDLALWQANQVSERLRAQGHHPEIVVIKTTGDKRRDVSLAQIGGKGLFIKELEEALERNEIDLAVHSLKDVPSIIPEEFVLAGFLERADPRDAWVHPSGAPVESLPEGSVVGTSAPRRRAQLRRRFPKLEIRDIRGNVETRIEKTRSGDYQGTVLAFAGLRRLNRESVVTSLFTPQEMVPAAGQGIVTIETLRSREEMQSAAWSITHEPTALVAGVERGVLQQFGSRLDCYTSIAAHAQVDGGRILLSVFVSDLEGSRCIDTTAEGRTDDPQELVVRAAGELIDRGVLELLETGASA
jgi:hydroxymethylbilane synthase